MKVFMVAVATPMILSGCVIGNGRICGPQTPLAYCDAEAYQALRHPKKFIEYWEKPGADTKQRAADAAKCGGGIGQNPPNFSMQEINAGRKPGERDHETWGRLHDKWEACMVKLGYHFTSDCTKTIERLRGPGCQAQLKEASGAAAQKP